MNASSRRWDQASDWLLAAANGHLWQVAWCGLTRGEGIWHLWAAYDRLPHPKPRLQLIVWLDTPDSPYLEGEITPELSHYAQQWQITLPRFAPRGVSFWSLAPEVDLILIRERTLAIPLTCVDAVVVTADLSPPQQALHRFARAHSRWLALTAPSSESTWCLSPVQSLAPWWQGNFQLPYHSPRWAITPARGRSAVIIGAGIAGCQLSSALARRGWSVALVEQAHTFAQGASGNPAGAFYPLLSRHDNTTSRLTRAALARAITTWQALSPTDWAQIGVLHYAQHANDAQRQQEIMQHADAADAVTWLSTADIQARWGLYAPYGGWWFAQGGWVAPKAVCAQALTANVQTFWQQRVNNIIHQDGKWQVFNDKQQLITQADVIVMTNGVEANCLPWQGHLPLQAVHGQISVFASTNRFTAAHPSPVLCGDGYVLPLDADHLLVGATYDLRPQAIQDPAADIENWARLQALRADTSRNRPPVVQARVSTRAVTVDKLPFLGHIAQGFDRFGQPLVWENAYVCAGLGSRGLTWAPLLAEVLAQGLEGGALPLEQAVWQALRAERVLQRAVRRHS